MKSFWIPFISVVMWATALNCMLMSEDFSSDTIPLNEKTRQDATLQLNTNEWLGLDHILVKSDLKLTAVQSTKKKGILHFGFCNVSTFELIISKI